MKTVLFIEDESILQKSLSGMLQSNGFAVLQALDGEAGLQTARAKQPDLILLDLVLPRKDGFEVLADLKKSPETKEIPVIVLTNLEGAEEVERSLAGGATTYLIKANYNLKEVLQKIKETLG